MDVYELIKRHEGLRLKPYKDTEGHLTIGYGRALNIVGISTDEAETMLHHDVDDVVGWAVSPGSSRSSKRAPPC